MLTMQNFALEVLAKRSMSSLVIEECVVTIRTKGTWQDSNIAKDTLQRLIQNVGHFVFEILRSDEGIQQVHTPLSLHRLNFTASPCNIGVGIECLPQVV